LNNFLVTFRSFTDRKSLFDKLIERYTIPPSGPVSHLEFAEFKRDKLDKIRVRVTQTIKNWIESFYLFDFDEDTLKQVEELLALMDKTNGEAYSRIIRRAIENAKEKVKT
jgi:son of sevenless-like protein